MKVKRDKLAEGFMKLMTDMGATFVDVTLKKKKSRTQAGKNYLLKPKVQ